MNNFGDMLEFKDCLRQLIEDNGGLSSNNLMRIAEDLREVEPSFSPRRLSALLSGQQRPNASERRAISKVLELPSVRWLSDYWLLEDIEPRRIAKFALNWTKSHERAREFVEYTAQQARYRVKDLSNDDLRELYLQFDSEERRLEVDIEVFDLSGVNG